MFVGVFFVFVTILTSVYGSCQSLDGQSVPWWILYQQKERPFFHQYVDSTNSHRIKEHYPERRDSVLSRVMSYVIDKEEAEYIIYSSDLVNVKDIAAKTSIPTYSKWMHGILGTTSSWKSGFWMLHNNLLFPALTNGALAVPGSKAWYATTVGDSSADIFYICLTAENKGNMTEMLISIMAGNPFIYKRKLHDNDFLQPYLKDVQPLQTSFGYEMSATIFLNCMYASSNNISTNCLFTYAVTTGVGINVFTRPRGMIKHSSTFCYDDLSLSLFDFLKLEKSSALKSGFTHSMFALSDHTGTTCFGQDVAANAETVAVMICATLPNVHGTIINSARLTKWSCRQDNKNKYNYGKEEQGTTILNFPAIKHTPVSKALVRYNEDENRQMTVNAVDDADEKNITKFCQMYDCDSYGDNQNEAEHLKSHPLKNAIMKNQKIAKWFTEMVAEIEIQNNIEHPQKTKKMFKKEKNAIKVRGAREVSQVLLKNKKAVLALFCREGCRFCQNAREQFILLSRSIQTDYLDFCIVDILEPSLPDFLQVPFTPYVRYKFSGLSRWIDYSGEKYDIKDILTFLHTATTVNRYFDEGHALTDANAELNTTIINLAISERKRRDTRDFYGEQANNLDSRKKTSSRLKREIIKSFKTKHIWQYHDPIHVKEEEVRNKLVDLNAILKGKNDRKTNTFIVTSDHKNTELKLDEIVRKIYYQTRENDKKNNKKKICKDKKKQPTFPVNGIKIRDIDAILVHATYTEEDGIETFHCWVFEDIEISVFAFYDNENFKVYHFHTKPNIEHAPNLCERNNVNN